MNKGTVKFFNEAKGFGFIKSEENGNDVFVHQSGLRDHIQENDEVTYDIEDTPKGAAAINVQRA